MTDILKGRSFLKNCNQCNLHIIGQTISRFWKTHVGHEEDTGTQHLSKLDKKEIVKKLCDGVIVERIISDARKVKSEELHRLNLINRKDIAYLSKKHNILQKKHENTMIAVNLKVKEWNVDGKNYCFFFKQKGTIPKISVFFYCYNKIEFEE